VVTIVGAAAVAAAVRSRRSDKEAAIPTGGPVRHGRRAVRNARLAVLGARTGSAYAAHRARRVFADAGRRQQLDTEFEMRTAEQIADTI